MSNVTGTDMATLAMAAFTAWLAWETRKMARAAAASNQLVASPYLSAGRFELTEGPLLGAAQNPPPHCAQLMVKLRNPGRVRISYDVERADFTMLGAIGAQGQWNNHNGVLHPDEESSFYLLPLAIPRGLAIGDSATTAIRVRYWDDPNIRHTLSQELEIVVTGVNPLRWRWSYTAGPTYA